MKLRVVPALVTAIFAVAMFILDRWLPVGEFEFFGRELLSYLLLALGFLIAAIALFQFGKAKTTINPKYPEKVTKLVTTGIFNYTRNPMYLALLILLIVWGLRLGNAFNTLLAAGFVYYMNHFQIGPEEEALGKKFGKEYQLYKRSVRRWF